MGRMLLRVWRVWGAEIRCRSPLKGPKSKNPSRRGRGSCHILKGANYFAIESSFLVSSAFFLSFFFFLSFLVSDFLVSSFLSALPAS